jgi:hypothetical protein
LVDVFKFCSLGYQPLTRTDSLVLHRRHSIIKGLPTVISMKKLEIQGEPGDKDVPMNPPTPSTVALETRGEDRDYTWHSRIFLLLL